VAWCKDGIWNPSSILRDGNQYFSTSEFHTKKNPPPFGELASS
jgi:hypothetical protein